MIDSDLTEFCAIWDAAYQIYNLEQTDAATGLVFSLLQPYPMDEVKASIEAHLRDPDDGRFPPKPAHLIRRLDQVMEWRRDLEIRDASGRLIQDHLGNYYDVDTGDMLTKEADIKEMRRLTHD